MAVLQHGADFFLSPSEDNVRKAAHAMSHQRSRLQPKPRTSRSGAVTAFCRYELCWYDLASGKSEFKLFELECRKVLASSNICNSSKPSPEAYGFCDRNAGCTSTLSSVAVSLLPESWNNPATYDP